MRKKGHSALWFATALLYLIEVSILTIPFLCSGSEVPVAIIGILLFLVPLQLIGALVLYLVVRILLRRRARGLGEPGIIRQVRGIEG